MRFLRDLMNKRNERLKIFATLNSLFILNPQPRSLGLHHCELIKVSDENEYEQKKNNVSNLNISGSPMAKSLINHVIYSSKFCNLLITLQLAMRWFEASALVDWSTLSLTSGPAHNNLPC